MQAQLLGRPAETDQIVETHDTAASRFAKNGNTAQMRQLGGVEPTRLALFQFRRQ